MKILHVPHAYHPVVGGAEAICKRVSEELAARGHDVHVLTTDVGAVQAYYEFGHRRVGPADETIAGVRVTRLPYSNVMWDAGASIANTIRPARIGRAAASRAMNMLRRRLADTIASRIADHRPDIVMTLPHLVVNVCAVLEARRRAAFPLVLVPMLHEHDPNWDAAAMSDALRQADAVIALTTHERRRLATAYGVPGEKIFMASVGIDASASDPSGSIRAQRVVFLGRKATTKGIDILIEAMRSVWVENPDVELCIAGVRLPETDAIDRQIAALPDECRRRVTDLPTLTDDEKTALIGSARCLVLPSKIESFGMAILDAWACATPVVTWDLPVFRSVVEDGRTGFLADPDEGAPALARAILRLVNDPAAAVQMGRAGRREAADAYSWESVAATYLLAYEYASSHFRAESGVAC